MESLRPLLVVMTPVRNEAWVLRAFLNSTSLWADSIIVADQFSTDGSREICEQYDNVIVINNENQDFNEAERQSMLVAKAREVAAGRDCILFGLDADEIMPANWLETADGKSILNSFPGTVFWFKWAQLSPDKRHFGDSPYYPWAFHDDGVEPHGNYVRNMHSMRIPYPIEEKSMHYVKDFRVLHCGLLDPERVAAKNRFYQFVDWEMNKRSPIKLSRAYGAHRIENQESDFPYSLANDAIDFPFSFWDSIELGARHTWFDDYIKDHLSSHSLTSLRKLDIWDESFFDMLSVPDPRRSIDRTIHVYLHMTQKRKGSFVVRGIDKILSKLY